MHPTIPHATSITYLAEGAANVVYTLGKPSLHEYSEEDVIRHSDYGPATPLPTEVEIWEVDLPQQDLSFLDGKLLRLRKDLPTVTSVLDAQTHYEELITPLFDRNQLVEQSIVEVPEELIDQLTSVLVAMDDGGYRAKKRQGVYLSTEGFGTLVTDMRPRPGQDLITVELKPKWLAQSPSAPHGSRRCRTCALRAMRTADALANHDSSSKDAFCPLSLVSNERSKVTSAVKAILRGRSNATTLVNEVEPHLVEFLLESTLLHNLRALQVKLDSDGARKTNVTDEGFLAAMTLRDCTLFLRVSSRACLWCKEEAQVVQIPIASDGVIEARLGDLDLKSSSKADYWRKLDQQLIDGGWYQGTEQSPLSFFTGCLLQS